MARSIGSMPTAAPNRATVALSSGSWSMGLPRHCGGSVDEEEVCGDAGVATAGDAVSPTTLRVHG